MIFKFFVLYSTMSFFSLLVAYIKSILAEFTHAMLSIPMNHGISEHSFQFKVCCHKYFQQHYENT